MASPCRAATLAAAAASIKSLFRRLPRDSSRTRAVAVLGTSTMASSRATSHGVTCRRSPRAPSTAQLRSPNWPAHRNNCRYPASDASTRSDATAVFVAGSTAVAVCELLCGSTPMINVIVLIRWSSDEVSRGRLADFESGRSGTVVWRTATGRRTRGKPWESQPEGGRRFTSHHIRRLTGRYETSPPHPAPTYKSAVQGSSEAVGAPSGVFAWSLVQRLGGMSKPGVGGVGSPQLLIQSSRRFLRSSAPGVVPVGFMASWVMVEMSSVLR